MLHGSISLRNELFLETSFGDLNTDNDDNDDDYTIAYLLVEKFQKLQVDHLSH